MRISGKSPIVPEATISVSDNIAAQPQTSFEFDGIPVDFVNGIAHIASGKDALLLEKKLDQREGQNIITQLSEIPNFTSSEAKYQSLTEAKYVNEGGIPESYKKI